ncbi:MAG: hypothetical protein KIT80_16960 [Chitinophagaceae bacterium]|nr:hypothetical protein [Chitinophagaceae bacterium]MCW5928611.1 hypothetical protein [Chitinophagaceae bacterium]
MRALSRWAYHHPRSARWILVLLKTLLILLAWRIAILMQHTGLAFSANSFYIMIIIMLTGILLYPDIKKKEVFFKKSLYIRQKTCDALITFSSLFIFIIAFNTNFLLEPVYGVSPASTIKTPAGSAEVTGESEKTARQKNTSKKSITKQWKEATTLLKKDNQKNAGFILEMVLAITLAAIAGAVVIALSCSLACSGNEIGAAILLILGAGGIITGTIAWIRSIIRRKRSWQSGISEANFHHRRKKWYAPTSV